MVRRRFTSVFVGCDVLELAMPLVLHLCRMDEYERLASMDSAGTNSANASVHAKVQAGINGMGWYHGINGISGI